MTWMRSMRAIESQTPTQREILPSCPNTAPLLCFHAYVLIPMRKRPWGASCQRWLSHAHKANGYFLVYLIYCFYHKQRQWWWRWWWQQCERGMRGLRGECVTQSVQKCQLWISLGFGWQQPRVSSCLLQRLSHDFRISREVFTWFSPVFPHQMLLFCHTINPCMPEWLRSSLQQEHMPSYCDCL